MIEFNYNNKKIYFECKFKNDHIYNIIGKTKCFYEYRLLKKISDMNIGGTYIDIGSNIGNHTIYFALFCNSNRVISIEVHKEIYEILFNNLNLNESNKYIPFNVGIGDKNTTATLSDINENNIGMVHINNDGSDIQITNIDTLLHENNLQGDISLMKMDIEGYETKCIIGAEETIRNNKPIIISESRNNNEFNEFKKIMKSIDYVTDGINLASTPTFLWKKKK